MHGTQGDTEPSKKMQSLFESFANLVTACRALLLLLLPAWLLAPTLGASAVWLSFTLIEVLSGRCSPFATAEKMNKKTEGNQRFPSVFIAVP